MKEYQSLSHTRWDCKYHVVFIPKRRQKVIFGANGYPLDARCTCDPKYRARFQNREEPFSWARVQVLRWGSVMRLGENRPVELYVRQGDTHFQFLVWQ